MCHFREINQPSKDVRYMLQFSLLGLILAGAGSLLSAPVQMAGVALLVAMLGIPHGATDYWIYRYTQTGRQRSLPVFLVAYLGIMALYALLWWIFPILGLLIFLGLSAYHFGQSNWQYAFPDRTPLSWITFLSWGSWVIAAPVLFHFESQSAPILEVLLATDLEGIHQTVPLFYIPWVLGLANIMLIGYYRFSRRLNTKRMLLELGQLLLLGAIFYYSPVLLGFAVYFVLWHSWGSMVDQIQFFRIRGMEEGWKGFFYKALPYTIAAWIGLLAIWWAFTEAIQVEVYAAYGFLFIALVTLPHMLLIDRLFERLGQPPNLSPQS